MDIEKRGIIRLGGDELTDIVRNHVKEKFSEEGFEYESEIMEDGHYWPDMLYRGIFKESE